MGLEVLTQYVRDQTAKINSSPCCFTDAEPALVALKDSLWRKGLASLILPPSAALQEFAPSEDGGPLSNITPTTHPVVVVPETMPRVWDLTSQHILVRSEYVEAVQAALSANAGGADVFLVTGQPGIGQTPHPPWLRRT